MPLLSHWLRKKLDLVKVTATIPIYTRASHVSNIRMFKITHRILPISNWHAINVDTSVFLSTSVKCRLFKFYLHRMHRRQTSIQISFFDQDPSRLWTRSKIRKGTEQNCCSLDGVISVNPTAIILISLP